MRQKELMLAVLVLLSGVASPHQAAKAQKVTKSERKQTMTTQKPTLLACNLNAMTPAQRKHHDKIAEHLRKAVKEVKELSNGFTFRYDHNPALFVEVAEFVSLESLCCSFYHFTLEKEPAEGAMWLRVTGPKEAKSFIKPVLAP